MKTQELSYLTTLGGTLTVLGIAFSSDLSIGYSFIVSGLLLSITSAIKARKQARKKI